MHAKINPDISSGINPDISSTIKKEWQFIKKDFWLKALLFWLPIVLAFTLWAIFSVGIARNLAIGVVDLDNSVMSRGLTRYYDASPSLSVTKHYSTAEQGSVALRNGSIYGLVIIPFELEKNTVLGKSPQVTVFYNSQYILIGKLINAAVVQAHGTYIATIDVFKSLAKNQGQVEEAIGDALPISSQITPLFNSNSHYGQFLVAAAVPAVWQILIIATVVLSFGIYQRNNNNNNKNNWLMAINKQTIVAKLIPYIIIFWLQGIIFISVFYGVMNWPMHGNWFLLVFAQLLLVIACVSVATLFFFITLDVTRAMSFVAVFAAPAFAFMGVTFPTSDMPLLAQLWRDLLPINYYIEIQIQQVNYGAEFIDSSGNYLMLMAFSSCFYVAILLMNKKKST
ncbi:MAG: ABC transporter permease, partial [Colwellia sp.]|nr:ABC transporter permease [Colwellia sp.]